MSSEKHRLRALGRASRTPAFSAAARLAGRLGRLRELIPLTNLGLAVLACSALTWQLFARPKLDYVLQLVSLVGVGLVVVALVAVIAAAILVHRALKKRLAAIAAGRTLVFEAKSEVSGLFELPAWSYLPLIELSWTWEQPMGFELELVRESGRVEERLETEGRAVTRFVRRRFVIEDGFGLARIVLRREEPVELRVLPWMGRLEQAPMIRSLATGDELSHPLGDFTGDRVDMRRYVPGDPLKLALWKIYARTGVLMVRVPERAVSPALRVAAYLPSSLGDEPAAAAARVAIERRLLGEGWVFSADGASSAVQDVDAALALVAGSRSVRDTEQGDAAGLARFLETTAEREAMRVVLFVPPKPGPWLERCLSAAKRFGGLMSVVIVADGIQERPDKEPRIERWLKHPEPQTARDEGVATSEELAEVARSFVGLGAGAHVLALERPTGRALPVAVRNATRRVA